MFNWYARSTAHEADGQTLRAVDVEFDNFDTLRKEYENGVLRVVSQENGAGDGTAVVWAERLQQYDETGSLTQSSVRRTNYIATHMTWAEGKRFLKRDVDWDDQFEWTERATTYADGAVSEIAVVRDDISRRSQTPPGSRSTPERGKPSFTTAGAKWIVPRWEQATTRLMSLAVA